MNLAILAASDHLYLSGLNVLLVLLGEVVVAVVYGEVLSRDAVRRALSKAQRRSGKDPPGRHRPEYVLPHPNHPTDRGDDHADDSRYLGGRGRVHRR
jgi:hypothetical protein